jgi:CRP-like cAMP-binding protein
VGLSPSAAVHNRLLASLPPDALAALLPKLSPIVLTLRQNLYNPDAVIEAVYFPASGMISLIANLDDGTQAEVGIIGNEGMLGTSVLSGTDISFIEAMVQMPGNLLRLTVRDFRHEMEANTVSSARAPLQRGLAGPGHANGGMQWTARAGGAPRPLAADGTRPRRR